ncbi:hypothetical protein Syun_005491 [Stephania yunnanensis]|uniref:Uncharacterized protein n=1 Tax=Stephania yunnanensis TaxID=152371 RepID=A0AAP0Q3I0_9MAGN
MPINNPQLMTDQIYLWRQLAAAAHDVAVVDVAEIGLLRQIRRLPEKESRTGLQEPKSSFRSISEKLCLWSFRNRCFESPKRKVALEQVESEPGEMEAEFSHAGIGTRNSQRRRQEHGLRLQSNLVQVGDGSVLAEIHRPAKKLTDVVRKFNTSQNKVKCAFRKGILLGIKENKQKRSVMEINA